MLLQFSLSVQHSFPALLSSHTQGTDCSEGSPCLTVPQAGQTMPKISSLFELGFSIGALRSSSATAFLLSHLHLSLLSYSTLPPRCSRSLKLGSTPFWSKAHLRHRRVTHFSSPSLWGMSSSVALPAGWCRGTRFPLIELWAWGLVWDEHCACVHVSVCVSVWLFLNTPICVLINY